jgi:hypothetical protein
MRDPYVLGALAIALVLFLRNLFAMEEVIRYADRVKRKLYQLAIEYNFVRELNDEIRRQAEQRELSIAQAPTKPAYTDLHRREG